MPKPDAALLDRSRYLFSHETTTRFADLDNNNHINNVATAIFFEDMRVRFDTSIGMQGIFRGNGLRPMIVSLNIEFMAEAFYPRPVTGYMGTTAIGRSSWEVASILTQGDTVYAYMRAIMVCGGKEGGSAPLPDDVRQALESVRLTEPA
ncbi:thioesterase family protein [Sphingobium sp. Sx8-8]|uniref:acyl-CoA thioesterase n=1 Tax=Sphingobium sp. Sx8-8 TaxID=2933617 RepID=UPI001F568A3B|nr:thioesterase family protein [Sphingobium sp. Sx8-8]